MSVGNNIKVLRQNFGLTQKDLGIMAFVVCLIASKDTTQVDVIHIGDNTTIVKKNYDTAEIGAGLMIA